MKQATCCFTGHRPEHLPAEGDEAHPQCAHIKRQLHDAVRCAISHGYTTFISGMARGVDIWAAEAVLRCAQDTPGIQLWAYVPHPAQHTSWDEPWRRRYIAILARAGRVEVLCPTYAHGCMQLRNRAMVQASSRIIAVYDYKGHGGTAYTVNYARRVGCDVHLIEPCPMPLMAWLDK